MKKHLRQKACRIFTRKRGDGVYVVNFIVERVDFLFLKGRFSWTCTLHIESASHACLVANASSTLRKILNEMNEIPKFFSI